MIVKLQFFVTLVCLLFLVTIIIFVELTSATSKERMTTNIIFAQMPHPLINESSYASKLCIRVRSPVAQRYIDR